MKFGGAQGGSHNYSSSSWTYGGLGGYSYGEITLSNNTVLFIYVGGQPTLTTGTETYSNGGFNGGGTSSWSSNSNSGLCGGGGATHISTVDGLLSSLETKKDNIIIVAGGGGGAEHSALGISTFNCASGGGYSGATGLAYSGCSNDGVEGTQNSGYAFGQGGSCSGQHKGAGGGGWYGGRGASSGDAHGGGGSGYINTSKLRNAFMYGYNVPTSSVTATKTYTTTNYSETPTSNYAKSGHGAARITPVN